MKTKDLIAAFREYQENSNMHIVDIVEAISGCRCVPMNESAHIIVFDTVKQHEAWESALAELGYRVETVEITRCPSARWEIKRRYIAYPGYDINGNSEIFYCNDDYREFAFGLEIMEA